MTDDLATLLAAEEHRQGAPYVADPGHCDRCAEVDRAWAQAVCGHDGDYMDMSQVCKSTRTLLCQRCGLITEVER